MSFENEHEFPGIVESWVERSFQEETIAHGKEQSRMCLLIYSQFVRAEPKVVGVVGDVWLGKKNHIKLNISSQRVWNLKGIFYRGEKFITLKVSLWYVEY